MENKLNVVEKTKEDRIKEINEAEKILKITEDLRNEAITKKKMYEEQLKEKELQLKELGTTVEDAEKKLLELDKEYEEDLKFVMDNLPIELLKKWNKI